MFSGGLKGNIGKKMVKIPSNVSPINTEQNKYAVCASLTRELD